MRIAILSDIHGNSIALDTVLADLQREPMDQIVCLGDVAAIGPQPVEVIRRLREIDGRFVMGNTDEHTLHPEIFAPDSDRAARILEIIRWDAQQLQASDLDFLRQFEPTVELALTGDDRLLCYHGSPRSNTDNIVSATPDAELAQMLSGFRATIMAGGHTHRQILRSFRDMLLLNPGSVGLPFQPGAPGQPARRPSWAEYAIIRSEAGPLAVEFRRVPIDLDALRRAVYASGMPQAEWWLEDWA